MPRRTRPTRDEQNALRRAFYEKIERGELTIPEAIKAMREMTGLTQSEFAAHRGVSRRVIQDIERGTGNPTVDSLNSVAKLFGLRRLRADQAEGAALERAYARAALSDATGAYLRLIGRRRIHARIARGVTATLAPRAAHSPLSPSPGSPMPALQG